MRLIFTSTCAAIACGSCVCHSPDQGSLGPDLDRANSIVANSSPSFDQAMVEALRAYLMSTPDFNERLSKSRGTLFFSKVSASVVSALASELRNGGFLIETNTDLFRRFTDSRTGRPARMIRVEMFSPDPVSPVFDIIDGFSSMEGGEFLAKMKLEDQRWKVTELRRVGVP